MSRFYYVSHPEVAVDPDVPVPEWTLRDVGRSRGLAMLGQPWLASVTSIWSSPETKALEMANIVGDHLDITVVELGGSGRSTRSNASSKRPLRF